MDDNIEETTLKIIPSTELRLIPLNIIITHIYDRIVEKASSGELSYSFNIDKLIKHYEINAKISTPNNKLYIINEIQKLFPGIKIAEIQEKTSCSLYNSYLNACWEEDTDNSDDVAQEVINDGDKLETYDDIMLKQAIQESLKEIKRIETPIISIMGKKAEDRIQKSKEKYKKLYK